MNSPKTSAKFIRFFTSTAAIPLLLWLVVLLFSSTAPLSCTNHEMATAEKEIPHSGPLDLSVIDKGKTHILIEKTKYLLHLYEGDSLLKTYPSVFGSDLGQDKYQQGDGRTPEGFFKIRSMYDHDKWTKFIWIDYPNEESWKRFNRRKAEGMIPANASIGGDIGIHGVPAGYDHAIAERQNWTLGCISLTTGDIRELYSAVQIGTEIEIVP